MNRARQIIRFAGSAVAVVALALALGCQMQPAGKADVQPGEMSLAEARALAERTMQVINDGNLDLVDELYAPGFVRHDVDVTDDVVGTEAYKQMVVGLRTAFPDFHATLNDVMVAGDRLISTWTVAGTFEGTYQGQPPTGRSYSHSGVTISRLVDGKSVEDWVYYNALSPWQQVGYTLVPPAGEAMG